MDPLSGAASVFAVVSLTLQLITCIDNVHGFLGSLAEAPQELQRLATLLERLYVLLNGIRHTLQAEQHNGDLPAVPQALYDALNACCEPLKTLGTVIQNTTPKGGRVSKSWASIRLTFKRKDIEEFETQLDRAIMILDLSFSSYRFQVQTATLRQTQALHLQLTSLTATMSNLPVSSLNTATSQVGQKETRLFATHMANGQIYRWVYHGLLGWVNYSRTEGSATGQHGTHSTAKVRLKIMPSFLSRCFDFTYTRSMGHVSRSLDIYPVLPGDADIFRIAETGSLSELQTYISTSGISPFAVDNKGWGLLHCLACATDKWSADVSIFIEKYRFLFGIGLNPHSCDSHISPFEVTLSRFSAHREIPLATQFLQSCLEHFPDIPSYYGGERSYAYQYWLKMSFGSDLRFNSILQNWLSNAPMLNMTRKQILSKALLEALKFRQPDNVVRNLIQSGADVHYRTGNTSSHGGVLDALFMYTDHPFESAYKADKWLVCLRECGVNVKDYIQKELTLNAQGALGVRRGEALRDCTMHLTPPSICWDWWVDPASPAAECLQEFRYIGAYDDEHYHINGGDHGWPLSFPTCIRCTAPPMLWVSPGSWEERDRWEEQREHAITNRFGKKEKKRWARQYRYQNKGKRRQMPGAWIP